MEDLNWINKKIKEYSQNRGNIHINAVTYAEDHIYKHNEDFSIEYTTYCIAFKGVVSNLSIINKRAQHFIAGYKCNCRNCVFIAYDDAIRAFGGLNERTLTDKQKANREFVAKLLYRPPTIERCIKAYILKVGKWLLQIKN